MAKKPTIATLLGGWASSTQLNNIFTSILDSFDNTLSRDGSTPNAMEADLDMNSNNVLNVRNISADVVTAGGVDLSTLGSTPATVLTGRTLNFGLNNILSNSGERFQIVTSFSELAGLTSDEVDVGEVVIFPGIGVYDRVSDAESDYTLDYTGSGGIKLDVRPEDYGYNVKAFGATGDGTTDDGPAFNQAMTRARATGVEASVVVPYGVYLSGEQINVSRVSVIGSMGKPTIRSDGISSSEYIFLISATADGAGITYANAKPVVENIYFDGNSECGGVNLGIRHHGIKNCFFVNCDFSTTTCGLYVERNTQMIFDNHFDQCGIGIFLDGITNATTAATSIIGNHIADCDIGILLNEAFMLSIRNNVIQSCDTAEIRVKNTTGADFDGVVIGDNYFESQVADHVRFIHIDPLNAQDVEGMSIINNTFYGGNNVGQVAIEVEQAEGLIIRENFFRAVPYCVNWTTNTAGAGGIFSGNRLSTNVNGFMDLTDATNLAVARKFQIVANKNFVVRAHGEATITNGTTSVTVNHGLDYTPDRINLSFGETSGVGLTTDVGSLKPSSIGSTSFTINIPSTETINVPVAWEAYFGTL